jgi:Undecaprenyl-phosphate galactose phosphotransferase WbaP
MIGDAVGLAVVFLVCAAVYRYFGGEYQLLEYLNLWPILIVFWFVAAVIRLYHGNVFYPGAPLAPVEELRRMFFAVTLTYLILFAFLALTRRMTDYSRFVLLTSWFLSAGLLVPLRSLVRGLLKRFRLGQIPVLIVGYGHTGRQLAEVIAHSSYYGFTLAGFLDDEPFTGRLGALNDTVPIARKRRITVLLCCLPFTSIQHNLRDYLAYFTHVSIITNENGFPISWAYPINVEGLPGIELVNQLRQPMPRLLKITVEVFLAAMGILFLWPLFLLLALMVRLSSPGPVFYRAKRLGLGGESIEVFKFRTMYADADKRLEEMLAQNPELAAEWRSKFKLDNDARITPLGRFLRKTSLDELPQLFNVLRGEMAMVGPRPIVEAEKAYYGEHYEVFCRVKPGITGLWQVSGRSDTSYDRRVGLDLYYVFNWSIWLDFYILAMTFLEVARCRGAK